MACYTQLLSSGSPCVTDFDSVMKPCKKTCEIMYEQLVNKCYTIKPVNGDLGLCSDLPETNCMSAAGRFRAPFAMVGMLSIVYTFSTLL